MDRASKMITALPFFTSRSPALLRWGRLTARDGLTACWEGGGRVRAWRTEVKAGLLLHWGKSQKLQEVQLHSRTSVGLLWRGETTSVEWKACCGKLWWTCAAAGWIAPDTMSQAPGRHSKGLFQIGQVGLCHASSAWRCISLLWLSSIQTILTVAVAEIGVCIHILCLTATIGRDKQAIKGIIHVLMSWETLTYSASESKAMH